MLLCELTAWSDVPLLTRIFLTDCSTPVLSWLSPKARIIGPWLSSWFILQCCSKYNFIIRTSPWSQIIINSCSCTEAWWNSLKRWLTTRLICDLLPSKGHWVVLLWGGGLDNVSIFTHARYLLVIAFHKLIFSLSERTLRTLIEIWAPFWGTLVERRLFSLKLAKHQVERLWGSLSDVNMVAWELDWAIVFVAEFR